MDTGFDADHNELVLFFHDGKKTRLPRDTKQNLARELIKIFIAIAENH